MMYYRISKNEKNLFFGKKIAQVWAVTLNKKTKRFNSSIIIDVKWLNTGARPSRGITHEILFNNKCIGSGSTQPEVKSAPESRPGVISN